MAPRLGILVSLPVAEATPTCELAFPVLSGDAACSHRQRGWDGQYEP